MKSKLDYLKELLDEVKRQQVEIDVMRSGLTRAKIKHPEADVTREERMLNFDEEASKAKQQVIEDKILEETNKSKKK